MQEWVDTLRLKLREMKILSPKENLYSKLPEIRAPLLPTRDPMSPLPETPAIPVAIPGVERIVNTNQTSRNNNNSVATANTSNAITNTSSNTSNNTSTTSTSSNAASTIANSSQNIDRNQNRNNSTVVANNVQQLSDTIESSNSFTIEAANSNSTLPISSTSNTLTHNFIKMLYPVTKYSQHANNINIDSVIPSNESDSDSQSIQSLDKAINEQELQSQSNAIVGNAEENATSSLARTFANNVLSDPATSSTSRRNHISAPAAIQNKIESSEGNFLYCSIPSNSIEFS